MLLELSSLKKAIAALDALVLRTQDKDFEEFDDITKKGLKAGVVQNFEIAYELSWKFIKRYLESQIGSSQIDGISRMELFRLSAEHHLIDDVNVWRGYHEYRNITSHTYDEETAEEVFGAAVAFVNDAKKLLSALEARNG